MPEKIGDTLTALMCVEPDGSLRIFAQLLGDVWYPFVMAERAAFDRTLAKVQPTIAAVIGQQGIKFEVCTFTLTERKPL